MNRMEQVRTGWKADGTGSELHFMTWFIISGAEPSGFTLRKL